MNRLLQCGSSMGSQVLPANLLQPRLLSMGHSSSHEPAPALAMRYQHLSGHIHLPWCGVPHRLQGGYLFHRGPPWAAGGTVCLAEVFTMGCRGISAPALQAFLLLLSSLTLVSADFFSHIFSLLFPDCCCIAVFTLS